MLRGTQLALLDGIKLALLAPLALHSAGEPGAPGLAGTTWQAVLHVVQGVPVLDFSKLRDPREAGVGIPKCWVVLPCGTRL